MQPADTMEWPPPVAPVARSPRQTLGRLIRARRPESIPNRSSRSTGLPGSAADRSSEAFAFAGSIAAIAAALAYLDWAYAQEPWLRFLGVAYYPSKYWALAAPAFVTVAAALAVTAYMGSNFLLTPPPASSRTVFDELCPGTLDAVRSCDGRTEADQAHR